MNISDNIPEENVKDLDKIRIYDNEIKKWTKNDISEWRKKVKKTFCLDNICEAIAVMDKANELATGGNRLRIPQKLSILIFMESNTKGKGHISQINTCEGKTTILSILSALKVLSGYKVHVITSKEILAEEGVKDRKLFYDLLNISVSHNNPDKDSKVISEKECYKSDIVYGTINNFQFDWLRDTFEKFNTLCELNYDKVWLILDEMDSLLIDQGSNIAKLSNSFPGMESLKYVYINIWLKLTQDESQVISDFSIKLENKKEELKKKSLEVVNEDEIPEKNDKTKEEFSKYQSELWQTYLEEIKFKIQNEKESIIPEQLIPNHILNYVKKKLDKWIEMGLLAKYQYEENIEYKIEVKDGEKKIIPIDNQNTGEAMNNTILPNGLHQFLQIKHNLCLTYESLTSCYVSNIGYVKKYKNKIFGVTGTLGSDAERDLLGFVFNNEFSIIPTYKMKNFEMFEGIVVKDECFYNNVALAALSETSIEIEGELCPRPVLIICSSIEDVEKIKDNISNLADSANLVDINQIFVGTNILDTDTDLQTRNKLENNDGLHVIIAFLASNQRAQNQAIDRALRKVKNGSGQIIIRLSEAQLLDSSYNEQHEIHFEDVVKKRDLAEKARNENIISELKFMDKLFNLFSELYTNLKLKIKNDKSSKSIKLKYVLCDLKERWTFWLEEKAYTGEKIRKLEDVKNEFKDFEAVVHVLLEEENIKFNPVYSILIAEEYLNNLDFPEASKKAKSELKNAITMANNNFQFMFYGFARLLKIELENGNKLTKRFKETIGNLFGFESTNKNYKKIVEKLEKINNSLSIEINYLENLIGKYEIKKCDYESLKPKIKEFKPSKVKVFYIDKNNESKELDCFLEKSQLKFNDNNTIKSLDDFIVTDVKDITNCELYCPIEGKLKPILLAFDQNEENYFLEHIKFKYSFLKLSLENFHSLKQQINQKIKSETDETSIGPKEINYSDSNKDHEKKIISGLSLLSNIYFFPFLLPAIGTLAGYQISEGILDILSALVDQFKQSPDNTSITLPECLYNRLEKIMKKDISLIERSSETVITRNNLEGQSILDLSVAKFSKNTIFNLCIDKLSSKTEDKDNLFRVIETKFKYLCEQITGRILRVCEIARYEMENYLPLSFTQHIKSICNLVRTKLVIWNGYVMENYLPLSFTQHITSICNLVKTKLVHEVFKAKSPRDQEVKDEPKEVISEEQQQNHQFASKTGKFYLLKCSN